MLLLDVGNSRCKWAYVENGAWVQQGVEEKTDWLALQRNFELLSAPKQIIISNVGGEAAALSIRSICSIWPAPLEFVIAKSEQCGVRNGYVQPEQLGSDRWIALIAAWHKFRRACLVVNCGTATTIDTLSANGEFVGGLIVPGVSLMQQSLIQNTAQLRDIAGNLEDFPRNTANAIYTGVIRATAGAIQSQFALMSTSATTRDAICVISGGAAIKIEKHLGMRVERIDNLVLEGLKIIGEANA